MIRSISINFIDKGVSATKVALVVTAMLLVSQVSPAPAESQAQAQQSIDLLNQRFKEGEARLRKYEWIETSGVTSDGKQTSSLVNQCYFGADGNLQKVAVGDASKKSKGGLPGLLPPVKLFNAFKKHQAKEDAEYIQKVSELLHTYLPPSPDLVQQSMKAGKMAVNQLEPGKRERLEFSNYKKSGDKLSVEINLETKKLLGVKVSTYLDKPEEPFTLDVEMAELPDGTTYVKKTTISIPSKKVTVTTESTGFRHKN